MSQLGEMGDACAAGTAPRRPELHDIGLAWLELLDLVPLDPARNGERRRGIAEVENVSSTHGGSAEAGRNHDQIGSHDTLLGEGRGRSLAIDRSQAGAWEREEWV